MEFGSGIKDEDWIPRVAKNNACVITQDINIRRIRHQRELCEAQGLGMFYLKPPSKKGLSYWDQLKLIVKHWEEIIKKASKEKRPFSYQISVGSAKLKKV